VTMPTSNSSQTALLPSSLLDRRLLLVTGKGGVGKTTVAASLAWSAAESGKRVLVCELDAKGDLLNALVGINVRSAPPLSFEPRELHRKLYAMAMDPEESLKEYLRLNLRIPFVTKIGALSAAFDFLANAAPGVREIVTIGKLTYETRERHYDLVVVDATASGHIIGQLSAPHAINELVGTGLIRSQTQWMLDILHDHEVTGLVITTTPEETPVIETLELIEKVQTQTDVDVAAIVVNRVLPSPFTDSEANQFDDLRAQLAGGPHTAASRPLFVNVEQEVAEQIIRGVALAEDLRRQSTTHLGHLLESIGSLPYALVPQLFGMQDGLETTRAVATVLEDELGL
jgi:anion-transporting  ArsA/GET3 family ATPase